MHHFVTCAVVHTFTLLYLQKDNIQFINKIMFQIEHEFIEFAEPKELIFLNIIYNKKKLSLSQGLTLNV